MKILNVSAMELYNSNGKPTIEVTVILENGDTGKAMAPSGKSTGKKELSESRDDDGHLSNAVKIVNTLVNSELTGQYAHLQRGIDDVLVGINEETPIGSNVMVATSIAVAKAAASSIGIPLHRYIGGIGNDRSPMPMMNLINGGCHANNSLEIQETMLVPKKRKPFSRYIHAASDIIEKFRRNLIEKGYSTNVGDEGGFAPNLNSNKDAIELLNHAIGKNEDFGISLDVAATELYDKDNCVYKLDGKELTSDQLIDFYSELCEEYPIISIEDGMSEDDHRGWWNMRVKLGNKIKIVGDDLFVTNVKELNKYNELANAIIIKPNQVGTLSDTIDAINLAKSLGYKIIVSHRSGDTEDTFISHLAFGIGADYIKSGSLCRSERVAKYNELIRIEQSIFG